VAGNTEYDPPEDGEPDESARAESDPIAGEEPEELGVGQPEVLPVERGAVLEMDEDEMASAADTSLDMEGFETGAGFDLDDEPSAGAQDIQFGPLVTGRSTFGELDLAGVSDAEPEPEPEPEESVEPLVIERTASVEAEGRNVKPLAGVDADSWNPEPVPSPEPTLDPEPTAVRDRELPQAVPEQGPDASARNPEKPARIARRSGLEELGRRQKRQRGVRLVLIAALTALIIGAGAFAAASAGLVDIPGFTPPRWFGSAVGPPVALPGAQPETPVMSHVLFVDSWRDAQTPQAWAAALRRRVPDLLPFVTALSIDGGPRYALMVGPAYGADEANDLRGPLAAALDRLNPDPSSWTVQEAPYAFFLGEYEALADANDRMEELAGLSIPTYVLQVTYPDGTAAVRVYAGAFSDETQADAMGRLLIQNDLTDVPLTERRGQLPQ